MKPADALLARLRLPVIGSPMFIVSSRALVIAQCTAGIVGAFPSLNARAPETLADWLADIAARRAAWDAAHPERPSAPHAVNLIVHPSNPRLDADLETICAHRVPLVITSLNAPDRVVARVHDYGGLVLHDVTTLRHARRAIAAGVDGLILVCAGAGGHTGLLSPLAFTAEVRALFDGLVVLSGCVTHGRQVLAARALGADLAYVGTRFIASAEANADPRHQAMIVAASAADIVYTSAVTGVPANYLAASFTALGLDPAALPARKASSFSFGQRGDGTEAKAWRDIWSAGQGVGTIDDVRPAAELVARLADEYDAAVARFASGATR